MKVILSGFNLDVEIIKELEKGGKNLPLTPETLSAAYARISRDPRPVNELREIARVEVEKARKSNQNIIFNMGHHSVAEHAVFNFDIIGISRLACEALEKFRLCSFTEKSQRYITLSKDFLLPKEIEQAEFKDEFIKIIEKQNNLYEKMFDKLKIFIFESNPELAKNPKNKSILEGFAKEDARYITSLATLSQLGMTVNARNLELIFRRFASQKFAEIKELGEKMFKAVEKIAPSVILFVEANPFDEKTYEEIAEISEKYLTNFPNEVEPDVEIVDFTKEGEEKILSALLFKTSKISYKNCLEKVRNLSTNEKLEIFKKACQHLEFYDAVLREFELADITFVLKVSASCFAQLKRHRMATILAQDYEPSLGVTIPESIKKINFEREFKEVIEETEDLYEKMKQIIGSPAQYILTNAHRRRVLLKVNLRELYHISRLREDIHAQWDIRSLAQKMSQEARKIFPIVLSLLGGKDQYPEIYFKIFGKKPKAKPPLL